MRVFTRRIEGTRAGRWELELLAKVGGAECNVGVQRLVETAASATTPFVHGGRSPRRRGQLVVCRPL